MTTDVLLKHIIQVLTKEAHNFVSRRQVTGCIQQITFTVRLELIKLNSSEGLV